MRRVLTNACLVTMNAAGDLFHGSLVLEDDTIAECLPEGRPLPEADQTMDLHGHALLPGLVQSHVHCCQTLFRGMADDLPLLDWLRLRIWPLEAAHDPESIAVAARLAALELLRGGTTAILSMETVRHTEAVFETLASLPLRAVIGKCLMDEGAELPAGLAESSEQALDEALRLARLHPDAAGPRLRACLAPRFALCCSAGLLREVAAEAARLDLLIHTHGAEQLEEVRRVREATGLGSLEYLHKLGLAGPRLRLAHAVHLAPAERDLLSESGTHVLHCPSSNLKLGSGVAPIGEYLERHVPVSVGADGAACNNNLDALREARLAALLQKPLFGPAALPARQALELITISAARALGLEQFIGSLEPGKRADLVEIDLERPHSLPGGDPFSRIIYSAERGDIVRVFFDGEVVVENGTVLFCDPAEVEADARRTAGELLTRAGLAR